MAKSPQKYCLFGLDILWKSCKINFHDFGFIVRRKKLANIKSQIKRNKQNQARRVRNRVYRGSARTYMRKAETAIKTGDSQASQAEVLQAIKVLDKAVTKGVIHKNNAARRKSRLVKKLNTMQ